MDLRQLNALVAIADHGSFSSAARALHTVQSNISNHIARLEQELGSTLVDRSTGELTEEGLAVAERARRVQQELTAIDADVRSLRDEVSGAVRIGVIGTTARWLVPILLDAMERDYPKVDIVVVDATTTSLVPQLVNGRVHLAVVNLPVDEPEVRVEPLFDEDAVLVVPAGHPFHDREGVSLSELDDVPLLLSAPGTAFRHRLEQAAVEAGISLRAQAEIDGMRLLATLAFRGFGIAVLPASAAPGWVGGDWTRIPLAGAPGRSVGLARHRRGLLPAPARVLREVLRNLIRSEAESQPGVHPATGRMHPSGEG